MAHLELHNKQPGVEKLPDGRLRVERVYTIGNYIVGQTMIDAKIWIPFGTVDTGGKTTIDIFPTCRLIKQDIVTPRLASSEDPELGVKLIRVFEEIPATAEIQVGENHIVLTEDGRDEIEADFLQYTHKTDGSSNDATPGTRGASAPPAPDAGRGVLNTETVDNDGTLRHIKRRYITAGILDTTTSRSANGALTFITITAYNQVPSAPSDDYVLVDDGTKNPSGLPTRTYKFARGTGEISYDESEDNNGALKRKTYRYLYAPGAGNTIPTIYASAVATYYALPASSAEAQGHRVWTQTFVKGSGQISYDPSEDNNGALLRVTIRALTAPAGSNPITTPSGYYALPAAYQESSGHRIWTQSFAKGVGQISYVGPIIGNNGKLLRITIRALTAPAGSNPISTPAGYYALGPTYEESSGHRVWSEEFVKGDGEVSRITGNRPGGIITYRTTTLYDPVASLPTVPTYLIDRDVSQANGHVVVMDFFYDAASVGTPKFLGSKDSTSPDGRLLRTYRYDGLAGAFTPPAPSGYYLVDQDEAKHEASQSIQTYVYEKPPANYATHRVVDIPSPGKASLDLSYGVLLSPSRRGRGIATVTHTFTTSSTATTPWPGFGGVSFGYFYTRASDGKKFFGSRVLNDYTVSGGSSISGGAATFMGEDVSAYSASLYGLTGTDPSGLTINLDAFSTEYIAAMDGTKVYRNTSVTVAVPA